MLSRALFEAPDARAFAILDGAQNPELLVELDRLGIRAECLMPGAVEPEVEIAAPHLAPVAERGALLEWILSGAAGENWGVFLAAAGEVLHVAAHFRAISIVGLPGGRFGYLRYYDPRVLGSLVQGLDPQRREALFGEIVLRYVLFEPQAAEPVTVIER